MRFTPTEFTARLVALATATLFGLTVPGVLHAQKLTFSTDDLGAAPAAAEIRIDPGPAEAAIEQEVRSTDYAMIQAIAMNDGLAAARLLDSEFTWIDRDGRSRAKSDLVNRMRVLSAGLDANLTVHAYGRVALVTGTHQLTPDNAEALFARVWVHQPSGWRILLYQETAKPDSLAHDTDYRMAGAQSPERCDNPCRSLPYKPLSGDAQEIVTSFMAGERAAFEDDAEAVSRILGDDLLFVSPDSAQPMDKAQRLAAIRKLRNAGQVELPPAVASIAVWVFGNAAIMSADQESRFGEMLHATRVWAKRDGRWQLSFSQQTLVQ
jgi:ketosteroid isomerase-like protein